jgi:hypothetical protein
MSIREAIAKTRRTLARRRKRFVPSFKMVETHPMGFEIDESPKVFSDISDKRQVWVKVGQSMREIQPWQNPMAERYAGTDRAEGKIFEIVKVH